MQNSLVIEATQSDIKNIKDLLQSVALPIEDVSLQKQKFWVVKKGETLMGVVALEYYPPNAILRSFAVKEEFRDQGLGSELFSKAIEEATKKNLTDLYLLTTTADKYFRKKGWVEKDKNKVPESIAQSREYNSICPESAVCMTLPLT